MQGNPRTGTPFAMLICLPFYSGDRDQAVRLAAWIRDLGGVKNHDALLIVDKGTTSIDVIEPLREAFKSVTETSAEPEGEQGTWGNGTTDATAANSMWLTAVAYVYHVAKRRWFWLEPDAVPMRPTWLDEIEAEDKRGGKPFTGAFVDIPPHEPHMTGIAVYPPDVAACSLDMTVPGKIAWDYSGRRDTVGKGKAHFTKLIQHEYRIHGESPNFPTIESLSVIRPETAVFHRCKNDSLVQRLRERIGKLNPEQMSEEAIRAKPHIIARDLELLLNLEKRVFQLEQQLAVRSEPMTDKIVAALPIKPYTKTQLRGKPMKKKRTLSPEHKAKLVAGRAKAWADKKEKA